MADKFVDVDGVGWKCLSHPGLASGLLGAPRAFITSIDMLLR
jgi:hypothetical protein